MKILLLMYFMNSTLIASFTHPILILISIIFQTLVLCVLIWTMMKSSWLSFILFIIFLGGMMVLFVYITSLASNEKFEFYFSGSWLNIIFIILMSYLITSYPLSNINSFKNFNVLKIIEFMMSFNGVILVMLMMVYLLVTLIVAVKISNKFEGPLRNTSQ